MPYVSTVVRQVLNFWWSYLVHLKGCHDSFDQDCTTNGASSHANVVLSKVEYIIPESCFQVTLHLGQVEIWTSSSLYELMRVVEEVETKVKQTTRDGLSINGKMLLLQVPTTSTCNEGRKDSVGAEFVFLFTLLEVDLFADGVVEIQLTVDHVVPGWRT